MEIDFIKSKIHRDLVQRILCDARKDEDISGLMITGSLARGDVFEGSDLDIYILLKDVRERNFYTETKQGILIEYKHANFISAEDKLKNNSMEVYNYLDGCILLDKEGLFHMLADSAFERFKAYISTSKCKIATAHWLKSARIKITSAWDAKNALKASYVVSTSSFKILEAFWIINNKPMPPNGGVLPHLPDLELGQPFLNNWGDELFLGTIEVRISTAVKMIDFVMPYLE